LATSRLLGRAPSLKHPIAQVVQPESRTT
jgi:hypothetical protein